MKKPKIGHLIYLANYRSKLSAEAKNYYHYRGKIIADNGEEFVDLLFSEPEMADLRHRSLMSKKVIKEIKDQHNPGYGDILILYEIKVRYYKSDSFVVFFRYRGNKATGPSGALILTTVDYNKAKRRAITNKEDLVY